MPANRFFLSKTLKQNEYLLEGTEATHLFQVMRGKVGDLVELVNGKGEYAQAEILTITKHQVQMKQISYDYTKPSSQDIILAQGMPRFSALEWIIEKGTELGVTEFWLFPAERSEKKSLSSTQIKRLEALTIQALKQCGRFYLPSITLKDPLSYWTPYQGSFFYGDLSDHVVSLKGPFLNPIICLIGPEKGLSSPELKKLQELSAKGVKLHDNVLRTETASISILSQLYLAQLIGK